MHPEDEELLHAPAQPLDGPSDLETDVLILGAGNAAISLAARLKAVGVSYIMAEKNAKVGDNWALRYDSLKFHVPTSFCELPFLSRILHPFRHDL
jgi:cation diffusion facilitator CzcD-associated flavoprotein CzcO